MRFIKVFLLFVTVVVAAHWSKEDYEIFSLNDKLQQDLGSDITFYKWLGLEKVQNQIYKKSPKPIENYQENYIQINLPQRVDLIKRKLMKDFKDYH